MAIMLKFERHPSRVVFDPESKLFVVTWTKCGAPEADRLAAKRDPNRIIPSVSAICSLFDRGCVTQDRVVYAAKAVGRAWNAGDRDCLDTCEAKNAAQLVADLSSMCVNPESQCVASDIGQAMRHLVDEMSVVRFSNTPDVEFSEESVMPSVAKAIAECREIPEFMTWPAQSMRRRFMFCLNRRERSAVRYTLAALLFDTGSCPLLSLSDRRVIRMQAGKAANASPEDFMYGFCRSALSIMRGMKESGKCRLGTRMSQQQLSDSIMSGSGSNSPSGF